jgi:amidase
MKQSEYLGFDAVGLADVIARREVSATEVLEAAVERMAEVNPTLNAVIYTHLGDAREDAGRAKEGPLAGVPFLVKDYAAHVKGWPTSAGSRLFQHDIAIADAPIVRAYRRAGLVIFGKTNLPELGLDATTHPELHGPTLNPWDVLRTPGGSSGCSAAAVAAGIVPAAHASDAGGSIRIPASCCGLFGLKPSRGRVSFAPASDGLAGFDAQHALTRTVRDSAALLDAVCKPEVGDPYSAPPPERPYLEECRRAPGRLRIGFTTAAFEAGSLAPECLKAVSDAVRLLLGLGHDVEEVGLPDGLDAAIAASGVVLGGHISADLDAKAQQLGRPIVEADVEPLTFARYQNARQASASDYVRALRTVHAYGRAMAALFKDVDVLVTSTLGSEPVEAGVLRGVAPGAAGVARRAFMPNTRIFNLTGQPAMSVPLAWSDGGLPLGVQFVARMGDEATLFRLTAQLEQAAPWAGRRPAIPTARLPA